MYICLCKAVTDSQIREAVAKGATRFGQVRKELNLASQCGKCGILAREVFDQSIERNIDNEQLFYAVS
ncbi:MAG: (2Fe-2S)-binding protein [Oceanicoccus sp.]|uniref:bacterioferritin-associated ferredoxin n=1 Tax=Oceanicoccus sp. TaxID=2691044 RepID=UPI00261D6FFA|nr:bacterioferritin-associated ferredoxin [Oceanicoccus sp.]MCP3908299.1 (2Fe-2S)-binding protein [Oceanicoccus sp.]MDG1772616.1 bacterioferritin-associated ferredoxin [Oceanicoccus sp.]